MATMIAPNERIKNPVAPKQIWCGVYTRVSTDEQARGDFNSMDAQREYCQAFIKSREGEGWRLYPQAYDDPGWSGGTMDRPGVKRLLSDVVQGKVQVIVAYKFDRLSRDMKDFLDMLAVLERHGASFVSVTQHIDTSTPAGRVMRSILMTFSQFERETIAERTRDKMAAARRKGLWVGGHRLLGYEVDEKTKFLVPNPKEARQVKEMFEIYLHTKSLSKAARLINEQYRSKAYVTKAGKRRGGKPFTKTNLHYMLSNPVYIGKNWYRKRDELLDGQHPAIVDAGVFDRVRRILRHNGEKKKSVTQNRHNFLLKGLVKCAACGSMMTAYHAISRGKAYRYYRCTKVNNLDRSGCEVACVSAPELEALIVNRLKVLGENRELADRIVRRAQKEHEGKLPDLRAQVADKMGERRRIDEEADGLVQALAKLKGDVAKNPFIADRLEALAASRREVEDEVKRLNVEIERWQAQALDADQVRRAFARVTDAFGKLAPEEQQELMRLLVKEIVYDGRERTIRIAFRQIPDIASLLSGDGTGNLLRCYQSTDTLGRLDSNQGMRGSKPRALPLGYAPITISLSNSGKARALP